MTFFIYGENMKKLVLSLALLSSAVIADDFVIATGGEGGGYEWAGKIIGTEIQKQADKKRVDFDYEVINSTGSVENISLFNDGEAQLILAQADALNLHPVSGAKSKTLYTEVALWMYNLKYDIDDIEDIEGKKDYLMVLVDGSGGAVTMQSFVQEDSGYKVNFDNAILADDTYDAADIVCEGRYNGKKVAGMLIVGNTIPKDVKEDFKQCVGVGEATDYDFDDAKDVNKEPLYKKCTINKSALGGMKSAARFGDLDTVCVAAQVVYTTEVEERKLLKVISKAINKAKRRL